MNILSSQLTSLLTSLRPTLLLLCCACVLSLTSLSPLSPQTAQAREHPLPVSGTVSPQQHPLLEKLGVRLDSATLGGVPVFILTPKDMPAAHAQRVLLHFHPGGYTQGAGIRGAQEGMLMAGMGKFKVISVDYRLAPEHPYPAAVDDAMAAYRALLKTTPAHSVGVFGSPTGGALTLIVALRAKAEGLPLPGALGAGSPWSDLTKTGDTYFTNEGVDTLLASYEGWLHESAKAYAAGHDMRDPLLSPVYGDVRGFPPTLLTSGTRDLFLSNTVRMHLKLREAGALADLMVFEGLSHVQYLSHIDAPETRLHFTELTRFFDKHLQ